MPLDKFCGDPLKTVAVQKEQSTDRQTEHIEWIQWTQ